MDVLLNLATFAGVLVVLVVVHELGHFVTAKRAGVQVLEFGIGYPPRLFAIKRGDTEYSLNLLPLGGFVRMLGEEDPSDPKSFAAASIPWRFVILSAGVVMNAVLAFILFSVSAMLPRLETVGTVVVHDVRENSPAAVAGIKPDDEVLSVNGRPIDNMADLSYNINLNMGQMISMVLSRDGKEFQVNVTPRFAPPPGEGATGIEIGMASTVWKYRVQKGMTPQELADAVGVPLEVERGWENFGLDAVGRSTYEQKLADDRGVPVDQVRDELIGKLSTALGVSPDELSQSMLHEEQRSMSISEAVPAGLRRGWEMMVLTKNDLFSMVARHSTPQVTGPVGIYQLTGQVAQQATRSGISVLLDFAGLLSINLAILNALPIPMLDGGRLMFVVIEAVRGGRRISPDKERFAHLIGAAFLFTLIIAITFNDIVRLATGESLFR